jgi:hypothetical protein
MRQFTSDQFAVMAAVISVMIMALAAVIFSIAAIVSTTRRRGLSTIALCLWCVLAGFTLSGAIWSWMTEENHQYEQRQLQRLPAGTPTSGVELYVMGMLLFFVKLDHLGRRLLYMTVLIPLVFCIRGWRRAQSAVPPEKKSNAEEIDALFRP